MGREGEGEREREREITSFKKLISFLFKVLLLSSKKYCTM